MGNHAKVLNNILKAQEQKEEAFDDSGTETSCVNSKEIAPLVISETTSSFTSDSVSYTAGGSRMARSNLSAVPTSICDVKERTLNENYRPLSESVGHTRIEVFVGAVLGFFVSLAIDTIL